MQDYVEYAVATGLVGTMIPTDFVGILLLNLKQVDSLEACRKTLGTRLDNLVPTRLEVIPVRFVEQLDCNKSCGIIDQSFTVLTN